MRPDREDLMIVGAALFGAAALIYSPALFALLF